MILKKKKKKYRNRRTGCRREKEAVEEKQESRDKQQEEETKRRKPKQELEEYSEGVQKRIAKLTKKWREAERQKEAALEYAKGGQENFLNLKLD